MPKKTATPLRYPGGKAKLINFTTNLLIRNQLVGCVYAEPFAGGSGLAMELLFNNIVQSIILNDIDRSIYAFWYSVLNNSTDLIQLIRDTEISIEQWHIQKAVQTNKENEELLALGFSTLFLNRTNRSGIIGAGPIGGKKQSGAYKLDCRFNKDDIIERIEKIAARADSIQFYNYDAIRFINEVINPLQQETFVFFDPPYHVKGPGLYLNHYADEDHVLISEAIEQLQHPWIITYDNSEFISALYEPYNSCVYTLNYSAQNAHKGTELLVFSNDIEAIDIQHAH